MKTISFGIRALLVAGACLTTASVDAADFGTGVNIPLEKDSKAWHKAGQRVDQDERVTVLLREGENMDNWTEIIVIKEQPHKPISPGSFRSSFIRALRHKHGRSRVSVDRNIESEGNNFLFGYETKDEMELVQAMKKRGQGFLVVTYTCKTSLDTQAQKDLYSNILWNSEMIGTKKRKV